MKLDAYNVFVDHLVSSAMINHLAGNPQALKGIWMK